MNNEFNIDDFLAKKLKYLIKELINTVDRINFIKYLNSVAAVEKVNCTLYSYYFSYSGCNIYFHHQHDTNEEKKNVISLDRYNKFGFGIDTSDSTIHNRKTIMLINIIVNSKLYKVSSIENLGQLFEEARFENSCEI